MMNRTTLMPTALRRALLIAAALLASTAVLGFSQSQGSASSADSGHPSDPGVVVVQVEPGSPAEKAGVARGDIILELNGTSANNQRDVRQAIASHKEGDTVSLKLRHGDAEKTLSVALRAHDGRAYLGVLLFPEGGERFGMRGPRDGNLPWAFTQGAFVAKVAPGGPADKAGLHRGDVILSVDGVAIDQDHALSALIQAKKVGDSVTLSVKSRRDGPDKAPRDISVTLGTSPAKKPWLGIEYMMGFPTAMEEMGDPSIGMPAFPAPELEMPRAEAPSI